MTLSDPLKTLLRNLIKEVAQEILKNETKTSEDANRDSFLNCDMNERRVSVSASISVTQEAASCPLPPPAAQLIITHFLPSSSSARCPSSPFRSFAPNDSERFVRVRSFGRNTLVPNCSAEAAVFYHLCHFFTLSLHPLFFFCFCRHRPSEKQKEN